MSDETSIHPKRQARLLAAASRVWVLVVLIGGIALAASTALGQTAPDADAEAGAALEVAASLTADRFHLVDDQMRALIEELLAENPGPASLWARSRASFERATRQGALPDPLLSYRYFVEPPETRVGPQEHAFELSQGLPWAGKRKRQTERAAGTAASQSWEAADLERRLVAELKRAYFEAAYLQEALTLNGEEHDLLRRFEAIALRRYSTGQGIQQNVVKVQTDISRLDDRQTSLAEQLEVVQRKVARLIGRPGQPLELRPIELRPAREFYDRQGLERFSLAEHPRVRAAEQSVVADRAWAAGQKLESRPDFRVGVGYTSVGKREDLAGTIAPPEDNGQDVLSLSVGINIPIYRERIRSGVAEARESERADDERLAAVRDQLRYEIQEALLRLDSLGERARLYREVIVPQAEESLGSAEAAYTTDRLGFLDLLDAERILFQSRLTYYRLVADLWIASADLELAAAQSFPARNDGDRTDG